MNQAVRLDRALVEAGLARSRGQASEAIRAGRVTVNDQEVLRPSHQVTDTDRLAVSGGDHYVSRGAHKLLGALVETGLVVPARVLDAGASTGGFTQVLLEAGAERVYAVDVGHGQLAAQLRDDPRVVVRERFNLRELDLDQVEGAPVDLVVADVSFISIKLLLQPLFDVLSASGSALVLVKPQFELGRSALNDKGVVRDEALRLAAVQAVIQDAERVGFRLAGQQESALPGESGNREYFLHLMRAAASKIEG